MNTSIIEAIDKELARLQEARRLLSGVKSVNLPDLKAPRGRPKGKKNVPAPEPIKVRRIISDEGRARIAAAQKKRWAARKRAAKKAATQPE